jgi:hypothetical protein
MRKPTEEVVTKDELKQEADTALKTALNALADCRFQVEFSVAIRGPDGELAWTRAKVPERLACELSGNKDLFFQLIQSLVDAVEPAAVAFTSRADQYESTAAAQALSSGEFMKFIKTRGTREALKRGWVTYRDILSVCVQSPDEMLIVSQELIDGRYATGPASYHFAAQEQLDPGSMRMRLY